jgi:lipopolysaccharide/colanic/teichoic acid biosynthesis glycosyltransferase
MNKIIAALVVALVSPIIIFGLLVVIFSLGRPLIFRQKRIGLAGEPFNIIKMRTMSGTEPKVGAAPTSYSEQTTLATRFLRRSKIDELPQLFNIMSGDMNFFGPRALRYCSPYGKASSRYLMVRQSVRPGVIGLSQVENLDHTNARRRLASDLVYIKNAGFRIHFYIFLKLFKRLIQFRKENI